MNSIFTISLDFELHWGGFEKWPLANYFGTNKKIINGLINAEGYLQAHQEDYTNYFLNTRQVIPEMLRLFEQHEVHVTWATVGMLFHQDKQSLQQHAPALRPEYDNKRLSAYEYISTHGIGSDESTDPFHYAPSLIRKICNTPFQELGSHTFAHYYCNEDGQTPEQFRADLQAAKKSASLFGTTLRSLVFPRNQFNDAVLRICFEEGITAVRTNPLDWFWKIDSTQNESAWKRLNRGLDAYVPLGKKNTYKLDSLHSKPGYPLFIPASRLLRPYAPREFFLNSAKIARIKHEMVRAARSEEVYHLWWHPHNFGRYPEQSLKGLKQILNQFHHCHKEGMKALNMGEISSEILRRIGR